MIIVGSKGKSKALQKMQWKKDFWNLVQSKTYLIGQVDITNAKREMANIVPNLFQSANLLSELLSELSESY